MSSGHPSDSLAFVEAYPAVFETFLADVDAHTTGGWTSAGGTSCGLPVEPHFSPRDCQP